MKKLTSTQETLRAAMLSRRSLLKASAALGAVGFASPLYVKNAFSSSGELNLLRWSDEFPDPVIPNFEKASGIKSRYVMNKEGVLDIHRMTPNIPERSDDEPSVMCEMAVAAAKQALERAGKTAADIDAVIVGSDRIAVPCTHAGGREPDSASSAASTSAHTAIRRQIPMDLRPVASSEVTQN